MNKLKNIYMICYLLLSGAIYSGDYIKNMYLEVKHLNYWALFIIENDMVTYRDKYYEIEYRPESYNGRDNVELWRKDFVSLYMGERDQTGLGKDREVLYRFYQDENWRIADLETKHGRLLLSLLSKIQRFPLEEENLNSEDPEDVPSLNSLLEELLLKEMN